MDKVWYVYDETCESIDGAYETRKAAEKEAINQKEQDPENIILILEAVGVLEMTGARVVSI